ncbi:ABC transporter permease [Alloiococcus sp. CFN-8]|uniref:ABC transporter permease n=1 Tax=Alloiococcus sp. CFN-8 TaxID=3416081 RepID=UPI003CF553FF
MLKFTIKRLLWVVPILLGVIFIVTFIMNLTPGDPASLLLGNDATEEAKIAFNTEKGYYDPLLVKYGKYIVNAVQGDFGESYRTGKPVFEEVLKRFPVTFKLALYSIILTALMGIPLGIISAIKKYSVIDMVCTSVAMIFASLPRFWLGLLLILFFSLELDWLPSNGVGTWKHYVLPVFTLAAPTAASVLRMTRSTMLETIRSDYVRTARAKGAGEMLIVFRHELRNALLPVITSLGVEFGMLLGGAILIETVFSMQGISTLLITSIRMKDTPQVTACIIFFSLLVCITMLLVDLLYAFIDPRVRAKYSK